jgi:NDP-sugar pyrophosphorylase family protein
MTGARVDGSAKLNGWNWLGPDCQVSAGATVENSILWAGSKVEPGANVASIVVREGMLAAGEVHDTVV